MKDFIQKVARQAGEFLLSHFREDEHLLRLRASVKEATTRYDKLVDTQIVRAIREEYPRHSLLTEESGHLPGDPDWLWIVDSLDGTTNFANANPLFAVCIAVVHKKGLLYGVVCAPAINEFYFAEKGQGAFLNQKRVHVSETSELHQSYVLYCEGGEKDRMKTGSLFSRVYLKVLDMRKLGSAGLETAWVAAGRDDAYLTIQIEPWDVAPGVLLVQEAGGKVTDLKGNPWQPQTGDFLFSNGKVHDAILSFLP